MGEDESAEQTLHEKYRRLRTSGDRLLRGGGYHADAIPSHGDPGWGLSVVIRIEGAVRTALGPELDRIAQLRRGGHLVYAPDHLHSTVRSLEGFQTEVSTGQVDHYVRPMRRAVAGLGPLAVEYRGLTGSERGILACGYPSDSLRMVRERLRQDYREDRSASSGVTGGDQDGIRDTAHTSLVVFREPAVEEPDLADYVQRRAEADLGRLEVRRLSLVRYRPTVDSVHLTELARVDLPG